MNLGVIGVGAVALGAYFLLRYSNKDQVVKELLRELEAASKHISTEHDAALISMKCNVLGLKLLYEIKQAMVAEHEQVNLRSFKESERFDELWKTATVAHEEIVQLLQRLADRLAPVPAPEPEPTAEPDPNRPDWG